ncbi:unnamed protein product [Pleuronectes platessa]|uniref:Uncharacterized protein n=1 Tax=Pleuronectes platessa TaxID=8262 RepID=A0A9N7TME7_PLEPL|nr:unnamed protein product [Pleuronectes platessa]
MFTLKPEIHLCGPVVMAETLSVISTDDNFNALIERMTSDVSRSPLPLLLPVLRSPPPPHLSRHSCREPGNDACLSGNLHKRRRGARRRLTRDALVLILHAIALTQLISRPGQARRDVTRLRNLQQTLSFPWPPCSHSNSSSSPLPIVSPYSMRLKGGMPYSIQGGTQGEGAGGVIKKRSQFSYVLH